MGFGSVYQCPFIYIVHAIVEIGPILKSYEQIKCVMLQTSDFS